MKSCQSRRSSPLGFSTDRRRSFAILVLLLRLFLLACLTPSSSCWSFSYQQLGCHKTALSQNYYPRSRQSRIEAAASSGGKQHTRKHRWKPLNAALNAASQNDDDDDERRTMISSSIDRRSEGRSDTSRISTSTRSRRDLLRQALSSSSSLLVAFASVAATATPPQTRPPPAFAADTTTTGGMPPSSTTPADSWSLVAGQPVQNRRIGGLASKIRKVGDVMDELQRDLMQERWDLVSAYPAQLRSYVPVFTAYTDSAFPSETVPTDQGLRVALRYEVGRFFASVERFRQATTREALSEAYIAYADMSLHFDRYLHVGGLYTYYDDLITTEPYFSDKDNLIYANPKQDKPLERDLVVLIDGPDKGKTGIVLGIYTDGSKKMVVKLDRFKGMREIKVVNNSWVAKRLGEQAPDDVFLIPRKS